MEQNKNNDRIAVSLRLLCGVYLAYTAWDLKDSITKGWLYAVPVIFFAVVGLGFIGVSTWQLMQIQKAQQQEALKAAQEEKEAE